MAEIPIPVIDLNVEYTENLDVNDINIDLEQNYHEPFLFDLNVPLEEEENESLPIMENLDDEPPFFEEDDESLADGLPHSDNTRSKKELSNNERRAVYEMLLQKSVDGKLKRGVTSIVASRFSISIRTVQRIWRQSKLSENADICHKKTGNCGRKRVQIDMEQFRDIPLKKRTTLRSLACSLKMNKSTVHNIFKSGVIRRHSNAIKPFLKEENMRARLGFCISMLNEVSIPHDPIFKGMHNIIHIDEKWFYMTKKTEKYYLLPDEEDPLRTCKSKNFICKMMFLAAIARPRFDAQGNEIFNGKIGIFPFVNQEPAIRSSANRIAGTLETKPLTSINRNIMRSYLIEKILPAIREKWPRDDNMTTIFIQQDNARTHVDKKDEYFCQAARQEGFDIRLMSQPANSPDLNVLDLGFFSVIQSL